MDYAREGLLWVSIGQQGVTTVWCGWLWLCSEVVRLERLFGFLGRIALNITSFNFPLEPTVELCFILTQGSSLTVHSTVTNSLVIESSSHRGRSLITSFTTVIISLKVLRQVAKGFD